MSTKQEILSIERQQVKDFNLRRLHVCKCVDALHLTP